MNRELRVISFADLKEFRELVGVREKEYVDSRTSFFIGLLSVIFSSRGFSLWGIVVLLIRNQSTNSRIDPFNTDFLLDFLILSSALAGVSLICTIAAFIINRKHPRNIDALSLGFLFTVFLVLFNFSIWILSQWVIIRHNSVSIYSPEWKFDLGISPDPGLDISPDDATNNLFIMILRFFGCEI